MGHCRTATAKLVSLVPAKPLRIATAIVAASFLVGCTAVDSFGVRAVAYNKETSEARSSTVLLNVLRSTYRLPLQFTDLNTVVGSASVQGGISFNLPFIGDGSASPMASISGGPNFTIANLNSQEFYQGIQAPIRPEVIATLLDQGVHPEVLFHLVFARMEIIRGDEVRVVNFDVGSPKAFASVHGIVIRLARYGLYARKIKAAKSDKEKDEYSFCFDPARAPEFQSELYEGKETNITIASTKPVRLPLAFGDRRILPEFQLPPGLNCKSDRLVYSGDGVKVRFVTRSLLGIYDLLGGITRITLGLVGPPTAVSAGLPEGPDFILFNLRTGSPSRLDPAALFNDSTYFVRTDPTGQDASSQVMQILADLQALNSKASSFPTPGVSILAR